MVRLLLCLSFFCSLFCGVASANWSGYINDKTFVDQRYGYMAIAGGGAASAIRIVCFPPVGFRLYLDPVLVPQSATSIRFTIDSLDSHTVVPEHAGGELFVAESYPEFWDLVAQMVAGSNLSVSISDGASYRISLDGFTGTYERVCGWMDGSLAYQEYVDDYR